MKKIKIRLYAAVIFTALLSISCLTTDESAILALEGGRLAAGLGSQAEEAIKNSKNKKAAAAEEEKRQAEAAEKQRLAEEQRQREEAQKQQAETLRTFTAAVNAKDTATVQQLLGKGFDSSVGFWEVVKSGNIDSVRFLLNIGIDGNWTSRQAKLIIPAILNDTEKLKQAIKNGADLDKDGSFALAQVIANGNVEAVKLLLDEGVRFTDFCENIAISKETGDILRILIKSGDIKPTTDMLCTALNAGKMNAATVLVEEGASLNAVGKILYYQEYKSGDRIQKYQKDYPSLVLWELSPFSGPISEKSTYRIVDEKYLKRTIPILEAVPDYKTTAFLLKKGASLNFDFADFTPLSPLYTAIYNSDTVALLLKYGLSIETGYDKNGRELSDTERFTKYCLLKVAQDKREPKRTSRIYYLDDEGVEHYMHPLLYAIYRNVPETLSVLLKVKFSPQLLAAALQVAAYSQRKEMLEILIKSGAASSAPTDELNKALKYAVWNNNTEIAQILIKAGATVTSDVQAAAETTEMRKLLRSAVKQ